MHSTEAEGSTLDDAIARALALLGAPRERVEIEILANASRGLFGFGGRRARVRATLRAPLDLDRAPAADARPAAPIATAAAPAPERDATPPAAPPSASAPRAAAGRGERRRPPVRRPDAPRRPRPVAGDQPLSPAALEKGRALLAEVVRLCGIEGGVEIDGQTLVVHGDRDGLLIGRRGQTLDALEYVVNRAIGHDEERAAHVVVDANGYRDRRRAALEALARRMAERARSKGRPVSLNPMSPRERRIVHLALHGDPALTTRSAGSGFYRRLVIVPTAPRSD